MTPEPIFWTPNPAAQPGQEGPPVEITQMRTPIVTTPLPSALRPADTLGSAAVVQAQHQALSNLLASLQAATQKGSNRYSHSSLHLWLPNCKQVKIICMTPWSLHGVY